MGNVGVGVLPKLGLFTKRKRPSQLRIGVIELKARAMRLCGRVIVLDLRGIQGEYIWVFLIVGFTVSGHPCRPAP